MYQHLEYVLLFFDVRSYMFNVSVVNVNLIAILNRKQFSYVKGHFLFNEGYLSNHVIEYKIKPTVCMC